jgi:hypothetical protein
MEGGGGAAKSGVFCKVKNSGAIVIDVLFQHSLTFLASRDRAGEYIILEETVFFEKEVFLKKNSASFYSRISVKNAVFLSIQKS